MGKTTDKAHSRAVQRGGAYIKAAADSFKATPSVLLLTKGKWPRYSDADIDAALAPDDPPNSCAPGSQ